MLVIWPVQLSIDNRFFISANFKENLDFIGELSVNEVNDVMSRVYNLNKSFDFLYRYECFGIEDYLEIISFKKKSDFFLKNNVAIIFLRIIWR